MKSLDVLLIGDICDDVYHYGTVTRLSPEAPVPILNHTRTEIKKGMSANVADNLRSLGVEPIHIYGEKSSQKTRYIDEKTGHQLLRVDVDTMSKPIGVSKFMDYNPQGIILSDYGKGTLDYKLIEKIINKFTCPIFIDTKKTELEKFDRIYPPRQVFIKINEDENSKLISKCRQTIVTLGKKGAMYNGKIFPAKEVNVADACGAGDTFLAAVTYKYIMTQNIEESIQFAIAASSVTVQHMGVYAPTLEEINEIK